MIGRFIAQSVILHAVLAGVLTLYPRPMRISIQIPVLDVSFAPSQRRNIQNAPPGRERASAFDSLSVPNALETIRDNSNTVSESTAEIASMVGEIVPLSEGTRTSIQASASPPTDSSWKETKSPHQSMDLASISENAKAGNYVDMGKSERANHLISELRETLDRHFIYPPLARRHGWQGTVHVGLRLDVHGQLGALRVIRTSGYAILDDDAIKTLQRVESIPQARIWLGGRPFETELTVIYRLIEG